MAWVWSSSSPIFSLKYARNSFDSISCQGRFYLGHGFGHDTDYTLPLSVNEDAFTYRGSRHYFRSFSQFESSRLPSPRIRFGQNKKLLLDGQSHGLGTKRECPANKCHISYELGIKDGRSLRNNFRRNVIPLTS